MEQISKFFQDIMSSYGFWGCVVVVIVTIISQFIKLPLKKIIENHTNKMGTDKKVLTCWLSFLPLVVSLIVTFVFYSWRMIKWDFSLFVWYEYFSEVAVFAGLSTALYELIDGFAKAQVSKAISAIGDDYLKGMTASEVMQKYRELKQTQKEEKKEAKVEEKKNELQTQIKELQNKLNNIEQ